MSLTKVKPIWTLDQGLSLIRELQPKIKEFNFHLVLGGGVLNNGESYKDLDLYFLPLDNDDSIDTGGLVEFLHSKFGELDSLNEEYGESSIYLYKMKTTKGNRIDLFIAGA